MKKFFSIGALALFSVLCLSVTLSSCDKDEKGVDALVGTWEYYGWSEDGSLDNIIDEGRGKKIFVLSSDGTGTLSRKGSDGDDAGYCKWSVKGNVLTLAWKLDPGHNDIVEMFVFKVKNDKLYLYDTTDADIYSRVK